MALSAVLEFGDNSIKRYAKRYLVADCHFVFGRPYNAFSPQGMARCERVELTVIAPGKNDLELFKWFSNRDILSGRIVLSFSSEKQAEIDSQILYFEDARCFSLSEFYDIDSSRRRLLKMAISAEQMTIDDVTFKRI